jgi:dTDP-4-dehydrorhamnose reductase
MRVLIVGGDGEIARALAARLAASGVEIVATTRRPGRGAGWLTLDLAADPATWPELPDVDAAVLCAAVARVAECERDPEGARKVNVDGAVAMARRLDRRAHFLFLSTHHVLDGSVPCRPADAPRRPSSAYGRQKAEAEERLLAADRPVGIVRLAKVLTSADPMVRGWAAELRAGRPIRPFADIVNAPAPMGYVCALLGRAIEARVEGIVQVSGDRDLAYAEMALRLAASLGADRGLVQPVEARRPGTRFFEYPRYASLDSSRAAVLLGRPVPSSTAAVDAVACELKRR